MAINKQCMSRLQKEYKTLLREPVPHISAHPTPTNLLEWHFVLEGDKETDYAHGVYHGKIVFPPAYPFKPPSLSLYTPNGRFATNTKLCLSMTDYHPESWNPMWSVGTILTGLLSFMHDNLPTTGSISSTSKEKRQLAADSLTFNLKNPMFRKLFPEWVEESNLRQQRAAGTPDGMANPGQQGEADSVAVVGQLDSSKDGVANGWAAHAGAGRPPAVAQETTLGGTVPAAKHPPLLGPGVTSGLWTAAMVMAVVALAAAPLLNWSTAARHSI